MVAVCCFSVRLACAPSRRPPTKPPPQRSEAIARNFVKGSNGCCLDAVATAEPHKNKTRRPRIANDKAYFFSLGARESALRAGRLNAAGRPVMQRSHPIERSAVKQAMGGKLSRAFCFKARRAIFMVFFPTIRHLGLSMQRHLTQAVHVFSYLPLCSAAQAANNTHGKDLTYPGPVLRHVGFSAVSRPSLALPQSCQQRLPTLPFAIHRNLQRGRRSSTQLLLRLLPTAQHAAVAHQNAKAARRNMLTWAST